MLTFGVEYFWKSKYIIGSRFLKIKIYYRKSIFEGQNILRYIIGGVEKILEVKKKNLE